MRSIICIRMFFNFHFNWTFEFLLPATKLGQGYVFTRVCDSVHGGVCPIACWNTHTSPWDQRQAPPGADTPPEQTPPLGPEAGTPAEQTPPGTDTLSAVHAGRYGEQAGGTHPAGMQSCSTISCR